MSANFGNAKPAKNYEFVIPKRINLKFLRLNLLLLWFWRQRKHTFKRFKKFLCAFAF